MVEQAMPLQGLAPALAGDCRVLVLGSMPGTASLAEQRYYAHPRNRFWPLMQRLAGIDAALPYPQRLAALNAAGIGVWDVIGRCERIGSLDTAIVAASEVANPLAELLPRLPDLQVLAFNGGKAAQAFRRHCLPDMAPMLTAGLAHLQLPSTSPANAAFDLKALWQGWRQLLRWL